MRKNVSFSDAEAAISELMWNHFGQEVEYYFKLAVKKSEPVRNKYNCHLESVRSRLLNEIYKKPS